MDVTLSGND